MSKKLDEWLNDFVAKGFNSQNLLNWPDEGGGATCTTGKILTTTVKPKPTLKEWSPANLDLTIFNGDFQPRYLWTDGENIYYNYVWIYDPTTNNSHLTYLVLDKETYSWKKKIWNGVEFPWYGLDTWTDGENLYLSHRDGAGWHNYVLDKATSTWNPVVIGGMDSSDFDMFCNADIWSDGENVYYSHNNRVEAYHYVFNRDTKTWTAKIWNGVTNFDGVNIWTDGENIYYSSNNVQLILDKSTETWEETTWTTLTAFWGNSIWTDGGNIYYNSGNNSWVYVEPGIWKVKKWNIYPSRLNIWNDGSNLYCYMGNNEVYIYSRSAIGN